MNRPRAIRGLLLLLLLVAIGMALIVGPKWLAGQWRTVAELQPRWLAYVYVGAVGTGIVLLLGVSAVIVGRLWGRSRRKRARREQLARNPSQLTPEQLRQEVDENLAAIDELRRDLDDEALRDELDPLIEGFVDKLEHQKLEIVAFGAISSGKSSLLNAVAGREAFRTDLKGGTTVQRNEIPWPGDNRVALVDTPGLGEVDGSERGLAAADAAKNADLVLLVVDGPLREWEAQLLRRLGEMEKQILICLNKADWYDDRERQSLLGQLTEQTRDVVRPENIVAVRSQPTRRRRVRVEADGGEHEEWVDVPIDIGPLANRMFEIVHRDGRELLMANLLLQSRGLIEDARQRVRRQLDRRARQLIDRYMWGAGGAAALTPFPLVDVVAGVAINSKMVVDLGRIYHQEIDLNAAVRLLGELGKNLLSILGASVAAPAVATVVASLLKTVPGAGTIAGQLLQGIVQALVTRWIGFVFMHYFQQEMQVPGEALASVARREWARLTTLDELRKLISAARRCWRES